MAIIRAPNFEKVSAPLITLLGPKTAADPAWQEQAVSCIQNADSRITIACPVRKTEVTSGLTPDQDRLLSRWEDFYMNAAWRMGICLFWFCKPPPESERIFHSRNTIFRLACSAQHHADKLNGQHEQSRLVVGIEPGYDYESELRALLCGSFPDLYINLVVDLQLACAKAVSMLDHHFTRP